MRVCRKCGRDFQSLALKAILVDLGCEVYPRPSVCNDGEDHEFKKVEKGESDE